MRAKTNKTLSDKNTDKSILLMTTAAPSNAPWYQGKKLPPLGLSYVAGALEKAGFHVEMLDNYMLNKPIDEVKQIVAKLNPEIVGITCGSATYRRCLDTATAIKETVPSCNVVVGGWHASYMPDTLLDQPMIDYVIVGEGERAMVELTQHITTSPNKKTTLDIAGVGYKHEDMLVKNPPKFIENMDEIPFPARHLLPLHLYDRTIEFLDAKPADVMNISRGCPFSCAFCETKKLWGNACRTFSPPRVMDEVKYMVNKFGTRGIYFINDNFTIKKNETLQLCNLLKSSDLDLEWVCDTRTDLVNKELLEKMYEAGCKAIWFGVESGSPRILKKINRTITIEQTEKVFHLCKEVGIHVACSFMLGFPDETLEDLEATRKFADKLDPDWCQFNVFIAYPDSSLYQEILQSGKYDRLDEFLLTVKNDEFDYNKLMEIQRRFFHEHNGAPKRVLRRIRREGVLNFVRRRLSGSANTAGMA
ncbi:MAG TPA: radical SAM protein [Candidatus Sulfotelmatobacter sp.]|nr:radical SAM protein [Candidatus Sulfotelmatobacter sp.]